ncbi:MAG: hypothetical protein KJO61_02000 [Deltaproteobacteria bacterium]|nr:hypothetical protein [Deltaproteobacteria bacterium]
MWEKDRSEWKYYYGSIYEPYQRAKLRKEVQRKEYEIIFQNKYICYQLCKEANLPLPEQYACIDGHDDLKPAIKSIINKISSKKVIIKPIIGMGGHNVVVAWKDNDEIRIKKGKDAFSLDHIKLSIPSVVQEYFVQHSDVAKIYPNSVNTIRIVTLLTKEKDVIILGAYMRFGMNGLWIDNVSQGGISVGIDLKTGGLKRFAIDGHGKTYLQHPDSGVNFLNHKIPHWNRVITLAKKTQKAFWYYKLLGQDIAIGLNGPVIIEINSSHDNVGLELAFGPILKNETVKNEFAKYHLLVNKKQRNL